MNTLLKEMEIRTMMNELKTEEPDITNDNLQKKIRGGLVFQGFAWSEEMERKIRYCIQINPT